MLESFVSSMMNLTTTVKRFLVVWVEISANAFFFLNNVNEVSYLDNDG